MNLINTVTRFRNDHPVPVLYFWLLSCIILSGCFNKNKVKESESMFPFLISYDAQDNVTNMSYLLDGPAGKHGFVKVEKGRFVTEAGPIRFNATNLTGPANFPARSQADSIAARLARFGFNCIRLHYMDSPYGNFLHPEKPSILKEDPKTQRDLDPDQLDKMDYLISVLKKKGIYVNMNLHVARWWDERDGFTGKDKRPGFDKGLDNFEPRMIELQKEYAKKLLSHVNPYTGLPYTDDPCVAMIELNNENALFRQYMTGSIDRLPDPYASEFRKQWNSWLRKKYKSTETLKKAWMSDTTVIGEKAGMKVSANLIGEKEKLENGTIATLVAGNPAFIEAKKDFFQFMIDTERSYWYGMYKYLKNDLKAKSVVSGTQLGYSPPFVQADLDYIDSHSYWCHPSPVNKDWRIVNKPMVNTMSNILSLSAQRIHDKPYTCSEYNHPFPNQYGAEGQPMLRAYGRFQGWDGVFEYTYNHQPDFNPTGNNYFFSIIARTDVLAHMQACAAIFLRGDVSEGKTTVIAPVNFEKYLSDLVRTNEVGTDLRTAGLDMKLTLLHKTAVDLTGTKGSDVSSYNIPAGQKVFKSDTDELTWNIEQENAGYFTVNTANTKLFTGFPEGRVIELGDVSLEVGQTNLGCATISLVSQNATGFGNEGKASILLAATGLSQNKDMVIEKFEDDKIQLSDWGTGPTFVEGINATIIIPAPPAKTKCYSLDPSGNRMHEIKVNKTKIGARIVISPRYKTVWYEIEIL